MRIDPKMNVGLSAYFQGSVILPYIFKAMRCTNIIILDYTSVCYMYNIYVSHYDIYFMVH